MSINNSMDLRNALRRRHMRECDELLFHQDGKASSLFLLDLINHPTSNRLELINSFRLLFKFRRHHPRIIIANGIEKHLNSSDIDVRTFAALGILNICDIERNTRNAIPRGDVNRFLDAVLAVRCLGFRKDRAEEINELVSKLQH